MQHGLPMFFHEKTGKAILNINDVIDPASFEWDAEGLHGYLQFGYSVFDSPSFLLGVSGLSGPTFTVCVGRMQDAFGNVVPLNANVANLVLPQPAQDVGVVGNPVEAGGAVPCQAGDRGARLPIDTHRPSVRQPGCGTRPLVASQVNGSHSDGSEGGL